MRCTRLAIKKKSRHRDQTEAFGGCNSGQIATVTGSAPAACAGSADRFAFAGRIAYEKRTPLPARFTASLRNDPMNSSHPLTPTSRVCGWLMAAACWTACALVGCSRGEETAPSAPEPFAGVAVGISVPAGHGLAVGWELLLDEWAEQTGAAYTLAEYAADDSHTLAERSGWKSDVPAGGVTVGFFPLTHLPELVHAGLLAPLPRELYSKTGLDWLDVCAGLRENVLSPGGRSLAIPIACPTLLCYYRRDLLEQAGRAPPDTWDEYGQLVRELDRWAPGLTAVEPWSEDFRATMFLARAAAAARHPGHYSLFFDYNDVEPLIDTAGFVHALESALDTLRHMPPSVLKFSPADCRRELFAGRAALAIACEWPGPVPLGTTPLPDPAGGPQPSQRGEGVAVGFCRLPGARRVFNRSTGQWESLPRGATNHVPLAAFDGLCAGVSSAATPESARAGWNLLVRLSAERITTAFPPALRSPCRESHLLDASAWGAADMTDREAFEYVRASCESLRDTRLVAELAVVGRDRFRESLTAALGPALEGQSTPQAALSAAALRWREIIEQIGRDAVRRSYRRSLGLEEPPR